MTIIRAKHSISGNLLEGFQISCGNCTSSNFFQSKKHLPDQVVGNKFRERGWDVNASGHDLCPDCIIRKRAPRKKKDPTADNRVIPLREPSYLKPSAVQKLIAAVGLPPAEVVEIESPHRKFKITFAGATELQLGQIIHAEGEIIQAFGATLISSYIKQTFIAKIEKNVATLVATMHWYLVVEVQQRMAAE